jgi:tRNA threonylcarbamoyladenosine biosynthesis protein TsaB
MKILALETAGSRPGVCLWEDFRIKSHKVLEERRSADLLPAMDALFQRAGWKPADVDAVAVDAGPGRFTGIRLGMSMARTLGQALEKPVVDVTSLEALAAQGSGWQTGKTFVWKFKQDLLCVLSDALRGDVYMAVWRFHRLADHRRRLGGVDRGYHTFGHHFKLVHAPTLFPFERFLAFFRHCFQTQSLLFVGSASVRYRSRLKDAFGDRARFAPDIVDPDPRWVAALGSEKFFRRELKSYSQVRPLYLRPSYAEENGLRPSPPGR